MNQIKITSEYIKLDQFLKFSGLVDSGSDAKFYIQTGQVVVNDEVDERRGKKLYAGDIVRFKNVVYEIIK